MYLLGETMFDFLDDYPDKPTGSEQRYRARIPLFTADGKPRPLLRHYTHWFVHNCIVHPLLGVLPNQRTAELHQLSSNWLNRKKASWDFAMIQRFPLHVPEEKRGWWIAHNVVAHMAIGLCPTRPAFAFHDWTAKKMDVPGWA